MLESGRWLGASSRWLVEPPGALWQEKWGEGSAGGRVGRPEAVLRVCSLAVRSPTLKWTSASKLSQGYQFFPAATC